MVDAVTWTRAEGWRLHMPGVADVPRCGEREGLYGYDPAGQAPLADWPVSVDQLVAEERALIERMRSGTFEMMRADEIEIDDTRDE